MEEIRAKALYFLARRDYSRRELYQKLFQKGFAAEQIQNILTALEQENVLNEERFISNFIRFRSGRGMGPLKISAQLRQYGIDEKRIVGEEAWQLAMAKNSAVSVRARRFGECIPEDKLTRMRQARFLQQRGFTPEQIRAAFDNNDNNRLGDE